VVDFAEYSRLQAVLGCVGFSRSYVTGEKVDTHNDTTLFHVETEWLIAARRILRLPVPTWNDPGAVAGEIDDERRKSPMPLGNQPAPVKPAAPAKPTVAAKPTTPVAAGPGAKEVIASLTTFRTEVFDKFKALDDKIDKMIASAKAAGAAPAAGGAKTPPKPAQAAAAVPAAAAKPAGAATSAAAKSAPAAPAGDQPLESMSRKQLGDMARAMGIDPTGLKAEELRKKIADGGGGAEAAEESGEDNTVEKANILMLLIEGNYEALEANLVGDVNLNPAEGEQYCLGCGGDCPRCPHPEYGTAAEQVSACFTSVHESLGLEVPAV